MSNLIATLPIGANVQFTYDGKLRQGPIEGHKGGCVLVKTQEGYRSFSPNKVVGVKVVTLA